MLFQPRRCIHIPCNKRRYGKTCPWYLIKSGNRKRLSGRLSDAASAGSGTKTAWPHRAPHDCVLVLDRLKPTFNVGKIFRSAETFGCREIHLIDIDFFDPAPAMGAFRWVPAVFHKRFMTCYADLLEAGLYPLYPGAG